MAHSRVQRWAVAALVAAASATIYADLRVVPLVREDKVLVTCELTDGFTPEVRDAIASGLRTTFTYTVELKMEVPVWVDRTIDTAIVTASDEYDNLTRKHSLVRTLDGRVEEALVTDDEAEVRKFLTRLDRVALFRTARLERNRSYYVRVSAAARPRGASLLWGNTVSGLAKFTFIP